jgi:hypothetical protein
MNARIGMLWKLCVIVLSVTLFGCGSNSSSSLGGTDVTNGVVIGLTDAPGDFARYQVDVTSLTLTKLNGASVETVPVKTQVDFAQYADLTEFLTAATVPSGTYTAATMTLDFSNADIQVEDGSNNIVAVGSIVDEDGNPITTLQVPVVMADSGPLTVAPGVPVNMTVDFNLQASNDVDFSGASPVLTVQPFVVADIDPAEPKQHRLRGMLNSVDLQDDSFQVSVRPFFQVLSGNDNKFGSLAVMTDANTVYNIDGQTYQGANGLNILAAEPQFTGVIATGDVDTGAHTFTATEVLAGTSVPGGTLDAVAGTVVKRTATTNILTIEGATLTRSGGAVSFHDTETVQLGTGTKVYRELDVSPHTIGDISVGQRVTVFGVVNTSDPTQMDASSGMVRMSLTTLRATAVNLSSPFTVNLQSIDGRDLADFDFSGTGIDAGHDAVPGNYTIDTGTLGLSSIGISDPVKVRGFVAPFGKVGDTAATDFSAQTVVDLGALQALFAVTWNPADATVFGTPSTTGLTLDLTGVGKIHYVGRGGIATDLTNLGGTAAIVPPVGGVGLFSIRNGDSFQVFLTFTNFVNALTADLSAGSKVRGVAARGSFDDATSTLTTGLVYVRLE